MNLSTPGYEDFDRKLAAFNARQKGVQAAEGSLASVNSGSSGSFNDDSLYAYGAQKSNGDILREIKSISPGYVNQAPQPSDSLVSYDLNKGTGRGGTGDGNSIEERFGSGPSVQKSNLGETLQNSGFDTSISAAQAANKKLEAFLANAPADSMSAKNMAHSLSGVVGNYSTIAQAQATGNASLLTALTGSDKEVNASTLASAELPSKIKANEGLAAYHTAQGEYLGEKSETWLKGKQMTIDAKEEIEQEKLNSQNKNRIQERIIKRDKELGLNKRAEMKQKKGTNLITGGAGQAASTNGSLPLDIKQEQVIKQQANVDIIYKGSDGKTYIRKAKS